MRSTFRFAACFSMTAAALAAGASAQEAPRAAAAATTVTLSPKFVKGDVHKFAFHAERSDAMSVGGASAGGAPSNDVTINADLTLKVVDVGDGGVSLEVTIDSLKADASMPVGKYAFDSSKPEDDKDRDNPAVLAFKPLVGMVLKLGTDSKGVITLVGGEPAIPQGSLAPVANQFFTSADTLKFRWNNVLNARRDRNPCVTGQPWMHTDTFVAQQVGKFEMKVNNSLRSVTDGVAAIDSTGDMKLMPAKEGDKLAFELKDTSILATSTWDVADGLSRTFEMQRNFTLQGNAQGHDVVRASKEKVSFTRAKK